MFKNEENEKLKVEIKNYQSQLEIESLKYKQLQEQFEHKNNELADLVAQVFLSFRRIAEIDERNDYGHPEQKIELLPPTKVINSSILKENLYKFTSFAF